MHVVKSISRWLLSFLFALSLFSLATTASLVLVLATPDQLKASLKDSGIYDSFVDSVIQASQQENSNNPADIPLDRPEIRSAANTAFPPALLKTSAEQIIDGTYSWLDGRVASPDFKVDLTDAKQNLSVSLGDYAINRARGLPRCTTQQLLELQGKNIDPFNVPCLPQGLDPGSVRGQVINDISSNESFLKDPIITAGSFGKDSTGQSLFQQADHAPQAFRWLKLAPYILGLLAVIAGLGVVLLHDKRRQGLGRVGLTLLSTGIFLSLNIWLLSYILTRVNQPKGTLGKLTADNSQQVILSVSNSLTKAINQKLFIFCGIYILLGAAILLYLHLTKPKQIEAIPETTQLVIEEPIDDPKKS